MSRFQLVTLDRQHTAGFAGDVREGLSASPKHLSCRYLYDEQGSLLFEEICRQPEYYLTRAESEILRSRAGEIASLFPDPASLVELGSGSAVKTRLLIEAFLEKHRRLRYMPVDISPAMLRQSSESLLAGYPELEIVALQAEYFDGLRELRRFRDLPKLLLWLGSNVGNLDRPDASHFLSEMRQAMTVRDRALLGIDLRKSAAVLEPAYDDAAGVTARFSLNILERINREFGADFDTSRFRHTAVYNDNLGRVEITLASLAEQTVVIPALDLTVQFEAGEKTHIENSYKYSVEEIEALARGSAFRVERQWFDEKQRFSLNLLAAEGSEGAVQ